MGLFDGWTPANLYGVGAASSGTPADSPLAGSTGLTSTASSPIWHPDNPLLWFGGLLAVIAGAAGFAASGRVGPVKASGSIGKT